MPQRRTSFAMSAYPRPPITGVIPLVGQKIFGAQNLSGFYRFIPGHWALGLQKLLLVRFHRRAWLGRANTPSSKHGIPHPPPSGAPSPKGEGF